MRTQLAVVAIMGCLSLSACSSAPGGTAASTAPAAAPAPASVTATPTTQPAQGSTITGTGYRYTVPKGWGTPDSDVGKSSTDSLVADLTDHDGFADNLNVVVVKTGDVSPEQIEAQGPQQLKSAGFTKVAVRDRVTIAGKQSAHITALQKGSAYRVDQFYLIRNGEGCIVTFSFSPTVSQKQRDDLTGSVLSSWRWS